jgi:nucleotide-binding universal stress UspA family protein
MYHNILVPVVFDGDHDRSAPIKLAGILATPNAKITFLHVIEHVPAYAVSYISDDLQQELRVALRQEMDGLAKHLTGATGQIVEGHSGRTIVDYAKQSGIDLIIVASHRPELSDYFLGSTASHVVRHAACAVHVVR